MRWGAFTLLLVGCASPPVDSFETSVQAISDPSRGGIVVDASFFDDAGIDSRDHAFDPDQEILVGIEGQTVSLVPTPIAQQTWITYEGVATTTQADGDLGILEVTNDPDNMTATFTIPDGFDLAPLPTTIAADSEIAVAWTPIRKDLMQWSTASDCPDLAREPTDMIDTGSLGLPTGFLLDSPCQVTLTIDRHRDGAARPTGTSNGVQRRTIQFTVTP